MLALWLSNTLSSVKKKLIKTCKKGETYKFYLRQETRFL